MTGGYMFKGTRFIGFQTPMVRSLSTPTTCKSGRGQHVTAVSPAYKRVSNCLHEELNAVGKP